MQLAWRPTPASLTSLLGRCAAAPLTTRTTTAFDDAARPAGHARLEAVAELGAGRRIWERVAEALMGWELHREARMVVVTDRAAASPGCTIVNAGPFGPVAVLAPCRVVEVIDEPRRRGFAYGTLPGHPLVGEEQFTVELGDDTAARLRIRSCSRPVGLAAVWPRATRAGQELINRRYLAAARRLAAA